jgi:hypothetical protein
VKGDVPTSLKEPSLATLNDSTAPSPAELVPAANRNVPALLMARAPGAPRVCTGGGVICVSAPVVVSTVYVTIPATNAPCPLGTLVDRNKY